MALIRIGLISDTHGRLDPCALEIFEREEVEAIIHAGDIGGPNILWDLHSVAPVTAVRGNNDPAAFPDWPLAPVAQLVGGGHRIAVVHDLEDLLPVSEGTHVVVHGHSHIAKEMRSIRSGALFLNPGSASLPRSSSGKTVGLLTLDDARVGETSAVRFEVRDLDQLRWS